MNAGTSLRAARIRCADSTQGTAGPPVRRRFLCTRTFLPDCPCDPANFIDASFAWTRLIPFDGELLLARRVVVTTGRQSPLPVLGR